MFQAVKDRIIRFLAPSWLNKYAGTAIRAAFLSLGVWLKAHGADSGAVDQFLSAENANILAELLVGLALSMSFANQARTPDAKLPPGEVATQVLTAPKDSGLPKAKEPTPDPRAD